ncbi:MAG TPA: PQQ-binding-like beta-propeller repeat protein, partial [Candidatus Eremiobacteraeota bacterium]|nr:PQQ-binding-like beta-propeller repeat protein [Candidatus Eremiobacteraeota bacterium]
MLTFCQIFFNWKIRRKILILLIFIIIIGGCRENTPTPIPAEIPSPISTAIPGNSYAPADSPWPMFAHDPAHRGYTKNLGPVKGNLKWFFKTDGEIHSSPVIGSDEVIYTGSDDSYLYAIKPEGNLKWKFKTGGKIRSTPLIIQKGSIYIHSFDGYFYSINSDGKEEWKFKTGKNISLSLPVISEEGIIYINSSGYFYAISPKGKEIWKIKIKYKDASAVIGQDGTVYLSDYGIHALNSKGITKWYRKEENPTSPSSLGKGDTNYLGIWGEENNAFMAIAGNKKKFLVPVEGKMTGSPSISRDGNIYTGCYDGKIYSFDQKGNINWSFQTGDIIRSSPVIDGEGNIYTGSYDRYLYAINKKGKLLWKFKCHEAIEGSPSIGEDETLYFTSLDG